MQSQSITLSSPLLLLLPCLLAIAYFFTLITYNLFFHPLRRFPGPAFYAATRLPASYHNLRGRLPFIVSSFHTRYGPIVRIGPNELSFTSPQAWRDIYGHRVGKKQNIKDPAIYPPLMDGSPSSIILSNDADHARFRRVLSHAFSAKALEEQQPLIKSYVDLLIQRLRENCANGASALNIVAWYNWTTFDIIGDLAFGESFKGLEDQTWHPWVSRIFTEVLAGVTISEFRRRGLGRLVKLLVPKALLEQRKVHAEFSKSQVEKRLSYGNPRPDFFEYVVRNQGKEGKDMSRPEMYANAGTLVIAGSETTATLLSGVTYLLLKNPRALNKATREVREGFEREEDIDLQGVNRLKYVLAALDEGLRMYPPVPSGLARRTAKEGDIIDGQWIPGDTGVSVYHWAASHSPENFRDPDEFVPERWSPEGERPARYDSDKREATNPFSVGPRNCIGRNLAYVEMRLILARMLWNFDMELANPAEDWIDGQGAYLIWQKHPLMVRLKLAV